MNSWNLVGSGQPNSAPALTFGSREAYKSLRERLHRLVTLFESESGEEVSKASIRGALEWLSSDEQITSPPLRFSISEDLNVSAEWVAGASLCHLEFLGNETIEMFVWIRRDDGDEGVFRQQVLDVTPPTRRLNNPDPSSTASRVSSQDRGADSLPDLSRQSITRVAA